VVAGGRDHDRCGGRAEADNRVRVEDGAPSHCSQARASMTTSSRVAGRQSVTSVCKGLSRLTMKS
jgi:hypothetical protein